MFLLAGRSFTATGEFTLLDTFQDDYGRGGSLCSGSGGYDDIREGAQVEIRDEAGNIVGVGELEASRMIHNVGCRFSFTIEGVDSGSGFYEVEVSHRGTISYTQEELEDGIELTLG